MPAPAAPWKIPGLGAHRCGGRGLALVVVLVAWSGIYNVAASRGHWAVVEWFLAFGMRNSVELRAMAITPPPLDNPDLVRLGAGHFHGGCAFCHGAPGIPVSPIARHMLPSPPDLTTSMRPWKDEELFWIVQHGIKYTGMPGWVALEREDEIWAVVAFLKRIPTIDAESYRAARARRRSHCRPDRREARHRRIRIRRAPALVRAAMAPRAAGQRVRWCRSCTASLPSS